MIPATTLSLPQWLAGFCTTRTENFERAACVVRKPESTETSSVGYVKGPVIVPNQSARTVAVASRRGLD